MQTLIEVICAECGKHEWVPLSRAKKYKCCSRECIGKYNSKRYNKQIELVCPICGKTYTCKASATAHHRTCGSQECRSKWLNMTRKGVNNNNYKVIELDLLRESIHGQNTHDKSKTMYQHVVKKCLGLNSTKDIPKGYVIHHKDANHNNNSPENLIVLPKTAHRLIHTWFGNVMIHALHTGILDRDLFFKMCNEAQAKFYKEIIDLDVTRQVVLKQGELPESLEVDNRQPSIYRNIIEGSTTNSQVLADNAEDSNTDTSALPINNGDEIV